jgi:polysaccharide biosynthesis protein PslG
MRAAMSVWVGSVLLVGGVRAVSLPSTATTDGLGLSCHNYSDLNNQSLDMMQAAGVKWVRMFLAWSNVEHWTAGSYSFGDYDGMYNRVTAHGMNVLFTLQGPSAGRNGSLFYGDDPTSSTWQTAFKNFCVQAAARYKTGGNVMYELWNEPDYTSGSKPVLSASTYMAIAKQVLPAIRQADPSCKILGPALSTITESRSSAFLTACCQQGLLDLVDAVSVHPYQTVAPEVAATQYTSMRNIMQTNGGKVLPIVSSEWGYSTSTVGYDAIPWGYAPNAQTQGDYLARSMLVNMSQGIPLSFWFDWRESLSGYFTSFCIVDSKYQPRIAYNELKLLTASLNGKSYVSRLASNSSDWLLLFGSGANETVAAWTTGTPHTVTFTLNGKTRSIDLTGTPTYTTRSVSVKRTMNP